MQLSETEERLLQASAHVEMANFWNQFFVLASPVVKKRLIKLEESISLIGQEMYCRGVKQALTQLREEKKERLVQLPPERKLIIR